MTDWVLTFARDLAMAVWRGALLVTRAGSDSYMSVAAVTAVGLMWLVALAQFFWARPRMSAVTAGLDLDDRYREDTRLYALRRWHKTYVALDFLKVALGRASLGLWA